MNDMTNQNNKEWWYHEDSSIERDHDGPVYDEKAVAKIVAEAERRTWEEARVVVMGLETGRDVRWPYNVPWNEEGDGWDALKTDALMAFDAKLSSLTKE